MYTNNRPPTPHTHTFTYITHVRACLTHNPCFHMGVVVLARALQGLTHCAYVAALRGSDFSLTSMCSAGLRASVNLQRPPLPHANNSPLLSAWLGPALPLSSHTPTI